MDKLTSIVNRHLMVSFQMLTIIIDQCPDSLWTTSNENESIGKRVLHVLESIDFWMDDFSNYSFNEYFGNLSPEMDHRNNAVVSRIETARYVTRIASKINRHFDHLTDTILSQISPKHPSTTYLDIVVGQLRHIQINIGYCNKKFKCHGLESVKWIGHGEEA